MHRLLFLVVAALLVGVATTPLRAAETVTIGYLEQRPDARYARTRTFARFLTQALGRPFAGAEVAMDEIRFHGAAADATFALERAEGKDAAALLAELDRMHAAGARLFVVDAPADTVAGLAEATRERELLLFNATAPEDRLRGEACQSHLLHVLPSNAMVMDALAQYLVAQGWRDILVLEGPAPDDQELTEAFVRATTRFGGEIVERRPFVLSNDPRQRDRNNIRLLTGGDYDVVFVADADGEFARAVPYQTVAPQLVVGSEGLAATAWHWAWERHGAPQLENRFEEKAGRPMRSIDWAAWMAVKAVAEAVQRTASTDFAMLRDHLLSAELVLDGFKGNRLNFRPWDRQLRQPVLLGTHNWVIERAPLDAFLHQTNNMDTLGVEQHETQCAF